MVGRTYILGRCHQGQRQYPNIRLRRAESRAEHNGIQDPRHSPLRNYTLAPVLVEYRGPKYMIYNASSNCTKGIDKPNAKRTTLKCAEEGYKYPALSRFGAVEDHQRALEPLVYKTESMSIIYCLYNRIVIDGQEQFCSPYPFALPITVPYELPGTSHNVTNLVVKTKSKPMELVRPKPTMTVVEDGLALESLLSLKLKNDNSLQPN